MKRTLTTIVFLFITGCTTLAPGELNDLLIGGAMGANQWAREERFLRELRYQRALEQQRMSAPFKIQCNNVSGDTVECREY